MCLTPRAPFFRNNFSSGGDELERARAEANAELLSVARVVEGAVVAAHDEVGRGKAAAARHLVGAKTCQTIDNHPWRRLLPIGVVHHVAREGEKAHMIYIT